MKLVIAIQVNSAQTEVLIWHDTRKPGPELGKNRRSLGYWGA
jgi:hypothetical protein